jgi:hypothetical protein
MSGMEEIACAHDRHVGSFINNCIVPKPLSQSFVIDCFERKYLCIFGASL